jgi:putative intracellular protease/amidase
MKNCIVLLVALFLFPTLAVAQQSDRSTSAAPRLTSPANGETIGVAFVLTDEAVMIDFAGPWEVFQDVMLPSRGAEMSMQHPFRPYTVSDGRTPIHASDGMRIVLDYTFDDAPAPKIVVVPAQSGRSPKMLSWLRKMSTQSDIVMSVCTGAFVLADAGLLDGKTATTHHNSYDRLHELFPRITVERNMRYVQSDPVIFTAGGLSSGIDLALHVVELYFGRELAQDTANQMEYEGKGWTGDGTATVSFSARPQPAAYASDRITEGPLGKWQGLIASPRGEFHIVVHLWRGADGMLVGAIDSLDQGAYGVGLEDVAVKDSAISFTVPMVMGSYEGALDGSLIRGTWMQQGMPVELTFARAPAETR